MTLNKMILLSSTLVFIASCATIGTSSSSAKSPLQNAGGSPQLEKKKAPNQYGWDASNCAHIMADGRCAHKTGGNVMDTQAPNANGWNSSNCAHIMADGTCAHPL